MIQIKQFYDAFTEKSHFIILFSIHKLEEGSNTLLPLFFAVFDNDHFSRIMWNIIIGRYELIKH